MAERNRYEQPEDPFAARSLQVFRGANPATVELSIVCHRTDVRTPARLLTGRMTMDPEEGLQLEVDGHGPVLPDPERHPLEALTELLWIMATH